MMAVYTGAQFSGSRATPCGKISPKLAVHQLFLICRPLKDNNPESQTPNPRDDPLGAEGPTALPPAGEAAGTSKLSLDTNVWIPICSKYIMVLCPLSMG